MPVNELGGNISIGSETLLINTVGTGNIAIGSGAMGATVGGASNIAIGNRTLEINDAGANIAMGALAMVASAAGEGNIVIGNDAGLIVEGIGNVIIGNGAAPILAAGANNIIIGSAAGVDAIATADCIFLGADLVPPADIGTIIIGTPGLHVLCFLNGVLPIPTSDFAITSIPDVGGPLGLIPLIIPSSRAYKHDIQDMGDASEIIYQLRPVTFAYNSDQRDAFNNDGTKKQQYGLIAEEVNEVFPYLAIPNREDASKMHAVDYKLLPALLLNEVQKINKRVIELQENNQQKDITIEDLRADNQQMKAIINDLIARITKLEARA